MIYFTSDLHFGHENIIKFSKRPFSDGEDMEAKLIRNWNDTVKDRDDVYVLGDFSFHQSSYTKKILDQLKGNKYLILGNHDKNINDTIKHRFLWVKDTYMLKVPDESVEGSNQLIWLSHYAHRVWDRRHYGAWNLHGHSHGSLPRWPGHKSIDVGIDCWNYKPVSYDQIKVEMDKLGNDPVDHHMRGKHWIARKWNLFKMLIGVK